MELIRESGVEEILVTGGGIIPEQDMEALGKMGVGRLFGPGTPTPEIVEYIREWFKTSSRAGQGTGA
jgi:methylmalonyl-CoA mutase C-terminal domain/subunit